MLHVVTVDVGPREQEGVGRVVSPEGVGEHRVGRVESRVETRQQAVVRRLEVEARTVVETPVVLQPPQICSAPFPPDSFVVTRCQGQGGVGGRRNRWR